MSVVISDETLQSARMSASELKQDLAVMLYARHKLTLGQASCMTPEYPRYWLVGSSR